MEEHNHEEGLECEFCKNGEAALKKQEDSLAKHGWIVHLVPGSVGCPFGMNIHTHGLPESQSHTDLQICAPIRRQTAHTILTIAIEDNIKQGRAYEAGRRYGKLISPPGGDMERLHYDVLFLESSENGRKVLRLIFPDVDGGFTGDFARKQMEGCIIPEGLNLEKIEP